MFNQKSTARLVRDVFPPLKIGLCDIQFVLNFKYLGHMINNRMTDDDDINHEVRNLFVRTNILLRHYSKCSYAVKLLLFKSYCMRMYDTAL